MYHRVPSLDVLLKSVHVTANLFWIGAIVAVGLLLTAPLGSARERGALARHIYQRLATPGFFVSFTAAAVLLVLNLRYYFVVTHFMHAKLLLVIAVIALHHVLGARARKLAAGTLPNAASASKLTLALSLLSIGAAWLALTEPF